VNRRLAAKFVTAVISMTADTAALIQSVIAAITPAGFDATPRSSARPRTGHNPKKTGSHLALNPQTKGTRNPQGLDSLKGELADTARAKIRNVMSAISLGLRWSETSFRL
jgi:hypothetical protein